MRGQKDLLRAEGDTAGRHEAGTLARLRSYYRELIDPKVVEHKGRIVKANGDGILIEFSSVIEQ